MICRAKDNKIYLADGLGGIYLTDEYFDAYENYDEDGFEYIIAAIDCSSPKKVAEELYQLDKETAVMVLGMLIEYCDKEFCDKALDEYIDSTIEEILSIRECYIKKITRNILGD